MDQHPFAQYVRTLGRGRKGARSLSQDEAYNAMHMVLNDQVEPEQLGAFLMLMRVKEESPEELAGFIHAVKDNLTLPDNIPDVKLDWSSYAGKRRQLPWFVLSALLLSKNGISVLMHGTRGNKDNNLYTPDVIQHFGLPLCASLDEAANVIKKDNFAFIPMENFCPKLKTILNLRRILGLRSPVNTVLRMINPFNAPCSIQGIFHPGYRDSHQQASVLLKQPRMVVFKGEGGEAERNPDAPCQVYSVQDDDITIEEWPALFEGKRHLKDTEMDVNRLASLWYGEIDDEYGTAAVTGTTAIALKMLGKADSINEAETLAHELWADRLTDL